jgi:nitrogenase-associated protein
MATIVFYEKPGCINNHHQKQLLHAAGHTVIARDVLKEPWSADSLHPFLRHYLVSEWFNRAAPQVKSGQIVPEKLRAAEAMRLLVQDPLLIRRPLMQIGTEYFIGFEAQHVYTNNFLPPQSSMERCPRSHDTCATAAVCQ